LIFSSRARKESETKTWEGGDLSQDRQLIETIKAEFARKSSARLREIVRANDLERWSTEALTAADEILEERVAGRAQEPDLPDDNEAPPPAMHYEPEEVALGVLSSFLTGYVVIPYHERVEPEDPDLPVQFGPRMAWLALETKKPQAVADALRLQEIRDATWANGVEAAHQASVFITPPLADWTLAVGATFFPPEPVDGFVRPLIEQLSRQFGEAQYFCTHKEAQLHMWARARQGLLVRGYAWLGRNGRTLWDEGAPTTEECELGFQFIDGRSESGAVPDEDAVMQLAFLWSIDPTSLDENFKEPMTGLMGNVTWADGRHRNQTS
jgi:hypothetical protein